MASASNTHNDADHGNDNRDFVPTASSPKEHNTVLSPVRQNEQPVPESDPRDGHETSLSSEEDDDMQVLTVRQSGKRPQNTQEIPVASAQPADQPTRADFQRILTALERNTELMAQQNRRIEALEKNQRAQRAANSPPRRHHSSRSPPRQETAHQRRHALERIQPQGSKRGRTSPLREERVSPTTKKGKTVEQPRHSPRGCETWQGKESPPAAMLATIANTEVPRRFLGMTMQLNTPPTGARRRIMSALSQETL
jgi:hypothetical protein